ncbi:MAG: GIY-YIG nuclease family protein [Sulfurimonas sp.]|nr:GIY-YIG nuclease family protein [Sulfurimonas sp.]
MPYHIYITTNNNRTVLYTGVTNNLPERLLEHEEDSKTNKKHFAGKYNAYHLIYYEEFKYIHNAIAREKEIKGWSRKKKEALINTLNPNWKFLQL